MNFKNLFGCGDSILWFIILFLLLFFCNSCGCGGNECCCD